MRTTLHLWLIPLLPLAGAAVNGLFGRRFSRSIVAGVALAAAGASFAMALWVMARFFALPAEAIPHLESYAPWIRVGGFSADFAFYLDQLSLVMLLVVTGIGFLIHVYSVGYMAHEGGYYRFFAYLNLFMFFMLTLVLADNYLLMFVGWEGVGLASYLLIGFFFRRESAAAAGKKAFIVNRIGDFGFLLGLFLLVTTFGSLDFITVFAGADAMAVETRFGVLTAIALLLFVGAAGKSAQIPLYVWLPDAMEGPTPVSALIHAATMVTAGVYMVARSGIIFSHAPNALLVVAVIGCLTALFAATIGMAQRDIKRVLAYSTVSQLGYMFLAAGVAAYAAAIFHLMTHAFFKALLFLAAGSVIHALNGEQDMMRMGGLRKKIPWTFWTMTVATFAIAGAPPLAGFFSKDLILWNAWSSSVGSPVFWGIAALTATLTSFYMFRLWFLTFFGEPRWPKVDVKEEPVPAHDDPHAHAQAPGVHPHESPWVMVVPLAILAVGSALVGWIGVPHSLGGHNAFGEFLAPVFERALAVLPERPPMDPAAELFLERVLMGFATLGALIGFLLAYLFYYRRPELPARAAARLGALYRAVVNKYYVDEGYRAVIVQPLIDASARILWRGIDVGAIDGTVHAAAEGSRRVSSTFRKMQSGNVRSYAGWVALGAALVLIYMLWLGTR